MGWRAQRLEKAPESQAFCFHMSRLAYRLSTHYLHIIYILSTHYLPISTPWVKVASRVARLSGTAPSTGFEHAFPHIAGGGGHCALIARKRRRHSHAMTTCHLHTGSTTAASEERKGEAISRAARAEAGARRRWQAHLVGSDQVPRQRDHLREEKASWCHICTARSHQTPTVRRECL